ncbi:hypothetical protein EMIT0357P_100152 [Pseudomonas marginalis]
MQLMGVSGCHSARVRQPSTEGLQPADCVEKVDPAELPIYRTVKMPFLHTATSNLSLEPSAQRTNFNLERVLFCRRNRSRLFQQNRPKAAR